MRFSLLRNVQTVSGANSTSYSMGTFLKRPRPEVDYSPPYSAKFKNEWINTSAPSTSLKGVDRDRIQLYLLICHKLNNEEYKKIIYVIKPCIISMFY
jgi:hypothetical protein